MSLEDGSNRKKYLKRIAVCAACLVTYTAGVCTGYLRMKNVLKSKKS